MKNSLLFVIALCFIFSPSVFAANEGDTMLINISGVIIDTPECVVNGNDSVDVDFGNDVLISRINSGDYKKQIDYSAVCGNVALNGLTLTISGSGAGFGTGLLGTDREGLGIRLYEGTDIVSVGEKMQFEYPSFPVLYAELVKDETSTILSGEFLSSATMVIGFQ